MSYFTIDELIHSNTAIALKIDNEPTEDIKNQLIHTMAGMERIRAYLQKPVIISSGYRCPALNDAVGGAKDSQHMKGEACDFISPIFGTPKTIALMLVPKLEQLGIDQLIMEGNWVHVSFSPYPRYEVLTFRFGNYLKGIV